jgi:predicted nucleic acid-binding Zn ribbon protein
MPYRLNRPVYRRPHVCRTCGTPFVAGGDARFCSPKCLDQWDQQRTRRYRCFRCNKPPKLMRWVRVSPDQEAPLCGTDECVIAWRPTGGWPDPTTRPLRRERLSDPTFVVSPPPRADALSSEIALLARHGRFRAEDTVYDVFYAVLNLLMDMRTTGLPSNPWREVPAFRILDLARAMRFTLGDIKEGSLDHHLLTCTACYTATTKRRGICRTGQALYIQELGLHDEMGGLGYSATA